MSPIGLNNNDVFESPHNIVAPCTIDYDIDEEEMKKTMASFQFSLSCQKIYDVDKEETNKTTISF